MSERNPNSEPNKNGVEEVTMTPEQNKTMIFMNSDEILKGLLAAAAYENDENEIHPIEISRSGKTLITFRIHPLSEEVFNKCRRKHTNYKRNKQLGIKFAEDTDASRYRSELIYEATVKDDQKNIWENRDAWRKLDCLNPVDLIDKVLKAGEKDAIIDKIEAISGYDTTVEEETAKN